MQLCRSLQYDSQGLSFRPPGPCSQSHLMIDAMCRGVLCALECQRKPAQEQRFRGVQPLPLLDHGAAITKETGAGYRVPARYAPASWMVVQSAAALDGPRGRKIQHAHAARSSTK